MALRDFLHWCRIMYNIVGVVLYAVEVGTGINVSYHHYINNHIIWSTTTLFFIIAPLIMIALVGIYNVIQFKENSTTSKCLWVILGICAMPVLPFITLVVYAGYRILIYHDITGMPVDLVSFVGFVKLFVALMQSLPNATMQLYIMTHTPETSICAWQWASVSTSLITFAFYVSTNDYVFDKANVTSRLVFFFFGLLAVTSRILMCVLYSMVDKPFFLVPIGMQLVAAFYVWLIKNLSECCKFEPLGEDHRRCDTGSAVEIVLRWCLTAMYNCFTLSGLIMSTINLAFALGVWYLEEVPETMAILATTLAVISYKANVILLAVEPFKKIGDHWLSNGKLY